MEKMISLTCALLLCSSMGVAASSSPSDASSVAILKDQADDTDLYAIPADTSEAEEHFREKRLEKIQKRLQQDTPASEEDQPK